MKTFLKTISFALFASSVSLTFAANVESNSILAKIVQAKASNDVAGVIRILPDVETLWPQQPEIYFKSAKEAVGLLLGARKNAEAEQSLLTVLMNNRQWLVLD
jgi:hypothetical protein